MKGLTTGLLLLFVFVSVAFLIAKGQNDEDAFADSPNTEISASADGSSISDQNRSANPSRSMSETLSERGDISAELPDIVPDDSENVSNIPQGISNKKLIAYYFHVSRRCYSCVRMQELSKIAIEEGFDNEIKSGLIEYRAVNLDFQENRHYIQDFKLTNPSVIIAIEENGISSEWANLSRVWQLYNNTEAFVDYVQIETKELLGRYL